MANENERLRQSRLKKINYSISAFFNEEEEDFSDNKSVKLGHLVHQMVFEKDKKIIRSVHDRPIYSRVKNSALFEPP